MIKKVEIPNLFIIQGLFIKEAISQVYNRLRLSDYMNGAQSIEEVARELELHREAFTRFLYAASSIGLINRIDDTFISNDVVPEYSSRPSVALFWFFHKNVYEILCKGKIDQFKLNQYFPDQIDQKLLQEAINYNLIFCDENGFFRTHEIHQEFLDPQSHEYIGSIITHVDKIIYPMFQEKIIIKALQEGRSQWDTVFGCKDSKLFNLYNTLPDLMVIFTRAMHKMNVNDDSKLVFSIHHQISSAKRIIDVGGGSGSLALHMTDQLTINDAITIYEVSSGIPILKKILNENNPFRYKIDYIAGSFLEEQESGELLNLEGQKFDLLILAWVLHDWSDSTCIKILRRCFKHIAPCGRIMIVEGILPDDRISPLTLLDVAMLLQTEGRERTYHEYCDLLEEAGFKNISRNTSDAASHGKGEALTASSPR